MKPKYFELFWLLLITFRRSCSIHGCSSKAVWSQFKDCRVLAHCSLSLNQFWGWKAVFSAFDKIISGSDAVSICLIDSAHEAASQESPCSINTAQARTQSQSVLLTQLRSCKAVYWCIILFIHSPRFYPTQEISQSVRVIRLWSPKVLHYCSYVYKSKQGSAVTLQPRNHVEITILEETEMIKTRYLLCRHKTYRLQFKGNYQDLPKEAASLHSYSKHAKKHKESASYTTSRRYS